MYTPTDRQTRTENKANKVYRHARSSNDGRNDNRNRAKAHRTSRQLDRALCAAGASEEE